MCLLCVCFFERVISNENEKEEKRRIKGQHFEALSFESFESFEKKAQTNKQLFWLDETFLSFTRLVRKNSSGLED